MGIHYGAQQILRAETKFRPITGDLLLIGRQKIITKDGRISTITDTEWLASICKAHVKALDVSDYEGAEIIHDMSQPVPDNLKSIADFIVDGSCLDNIFDPAQALRNLSMMLRPGGRIFLCNHGTMMMGALTAQSPEWYFDFFALNRYVDCQIWLAAFVGSPYAPWKLHPWQPFDNEFKAAHPNPNYRGPKVGDFFSLVIAEKGFNATDDKTPVESFYRTLHDTEGDVYLNAHKRYLTSLRRGYI